MKIAKRTLHASHFSTSSYGCFVNESLFKTLSLHFDINKIERSKFPQFSMIQYRKVKFIRMTAHKKQRRRSITSRFNKPGRSYSAVLKMVERDASREIQVERIQALLKMRLTAGEVHSKLKQEFGRNVLSMHSVYYYKRKLKIGASKSMVGRPPKRSVTRKILTLRERGIKLSVRKTSKLIKESYSTTRRHFKALGAKRKPVWRQPHKLSAANKESRVRECSSLQKILMVNKNRPFIVSGDESWIYYNNSGKVQWVFPWETPGVSTKKTVDSGKLLLIVFFSTSGIHLIDFVPENKKIDSDYFCSILEQLDRALPRPRPGVVWLHVDNAKPHRSRKIKI